MRNIIDVNVYVTKAATSISKKRVQSEGEKKQNINYLERKKR